MNGRRIERKNIRCERVCHSLKKKSILTRLRIFEGKPLLQFFHNLDDIIGKGFYLYPR